MNISKRKLLGAVPVLSGASALTYWQRPVIESILLPSHAQTSIVASETICVTLDTEELEDEGDDGIGVNFDGTNITFSIANCCDQAGDFFSNGNGIIIADLDLLSFDNDGDDICNGPFLDTDHAFVSLGDDNWSVTGPENGEVGAGEYEYIATRQNSPGLGAEIGAVFRILLVVSFSNIETTSDADQGDNCPAGDPIGSACMEITVRVTRIS